MRCERANVRDREGRRKKKEALRLSPETGEKRNGKKREDGKKRDWDEVQLNGRGRYRVGYKLRYRTINVTNSQAKTQPSTTEAEV